MSESRSVAVVTGASGGIGRELTRRLLGAGITVAAFDLPLEHAASENGAEFYGVDVRDEGAVQDAFDAVVQRHGRIDHLVCSAGVFINKSAIQTDPGDWELTMAVNLRGSFLCTRAVLGPMLAQKCGTIVYISSMLARKGGVNAAAYAASKGGLLGLARSVAVEVAVDGIRVNTVSPGLTDTPQPRGFLSEAELSAAAAALPMGRAATPHDVAEACLFLLGDDASFMTGQDLRVDGGSHLC